MKIDFILGSGVSLSAGCPSTAALTKSVLDGGRVSRATDSCYYLEPNRTADKYVEIILGFLAILEKRAAAFYLDASPREVSYEDIYYLISQVHNAVSGEYDNPAIAGFVASLREEAAALISRDPEDYQKEWSFLSLLRESEHYISDVVWRLLVPIRHEGQLRAIVEVAKHSAVDQVTLITLNHDLLLERVLEEAHLSYVDGFVAESPGLWVWRPDVFDDLGTKTRVIKVHGSIDWFVVRPTGGSPYYGDVLIKTSRDPWHLKTADGRLHDPVPPRPMLVLGNHNKPLQYLRWPFVEIHREFLQALNLHLAGEALVIAGYGGRDKSINERILEIMDADPSRLGVLVDPNATETRLQMRPALSRAIERWEKELRLLVVQERFETISGERLLMIVDAWNHGAGTLIPY